MKYNILIKYANSFPSAFDGEVISLERLSILCDALGRVNVGEGYINVFGGEYAHACGCALEAVLVSAGYSVCRITDICEYDVRECVFINGASPSMDDYVNVLTHIRSIVKKHSDVKFLKEEVVFACSLYMAKLMGSKYVILENTTNVGETVSMICPCYSYAAIPKVYDDVSEENLNKKGSIIDKVTRGVVTGNNNLYGFFSDKCQRSGIRLSIHRSFENLNESNRSRTIKQGNREYYLNSSSEMLRDGIISAIELIEILKMHGAKIPPQKITEGINSLSSCGLMDIISSSPLVISDIANSDSELFLLGQRIREIFEKGGLRRLLLCAEESNANILEKIKKYLGDIEVAICGLLSDGEVEGVRCEKSYKDLATAIIQGGENGDSVLIIGKYEFTRNIKSAYRTVMNKI